MISSSIVKIKCENYERIPIKTDILKPGDDIIETVIKFTKGILEKGDIIILSESPLAITQNRAIPVEDIKVGLLAKLLWKFVAKVKYGIGLRSPFSMQCAIDEVGHIRILFAAFASCLTKIFGIKGVFYRVTGKKVALIDAAGTSPIPPYDRCVILGPVNLASVVKEISEETGCDCAIMDINDIGGSWFISGSKGCNKKLLEKVMKDNPQGQGDQLTPICLVRKLSR